MKRLCRNCKQDLLIPFARQQTILRNILQKFKELVDPKHDGIVDELITHEVVEMSFHSSCLTSHTQPVLARRLWERLIHVPPRMFFQIVMPLLGDRYPAMFDGIDIMPNASSLPQMCFRHVVMDVLPLGDIADDLCGKNILPLCDIRQFHADCCDWTNAWKVLFDKIKNSGKVSDVKDIFRKYLDKCEIPVPEDLEQEFARGVPCVCQEKSLHCLQSEICCADCHDTVLTEKREPEEVSDNCHRDPEALCATRNVQDGRINRFLKRIQKRIMRKQERAVSVLLMIENSSDFSDSDDDFVKIQTIEIHSDSSGEYDS